MYVKMKLLNVGVQEGSWLY